MLTLTLRKPTPEPVFDRRGYYRSAVTLSSHRLGQEPPNKGRTFPPEVLTRGEAHLLLAAMGRGYAGDRDRAMFVVQYRCGLRVAEAAALYPKDIDLTAGTITVLHGKGDRRRVVGIDPQAQALVERWFARRRQLGLTGRQPLFCVISQPTIGERIHVSVFREKLHRTARKAGIDKRVHPHGLRHTFAYDYIREGGSIVLLKVLLGHADLNTTWRYVNHHFPFEAIDALRHRIWEAPTHPVGLPDLDQGWLAAGPGG